MSQLFALPYADIQSHRAARSISDDDLCAGCQKLAYCPGDQSLCQQAYHAADNVWPCTLDDGDTAQSCPDFTPLTAKDENWAPFD